MANLASGIIEGHGNYINVEELLSVTLEEGKKYTVQVQGGAILCEKETKPTNNEGFYWNSLKPFGYNKESAFLWAKVNAGSSVFINIAG